MENPALTETTYYILLSLYHPRTLYGALNALCERGWISPLPMESGSRKKEYPLTSAGLKVLKQELVRLEELAANGRAILQEEQV